MSAFRQLLDDETVEALEDFFGWPKESVKAKQTAKEKGNEKETGEEKSAGKEQEEELEDGEIRE